MPAKWSFWRTHPGCKHSGTGGDACHFIAECCWCNISWRAMAVADAVTCIFQGYPTQLQGKSPFGQSSSQVSCGEHTARHPAAVWVLSTLFVSLKNSRLISPHFHYWSQPVSHAALTQMQAALNRYHRSPQRLIQVHTHSLKPRLHTRLPGIIC